MLFTSIVFLYYFLPILLILYYLAGKKIRNYILLVFSLLFYAWGEPKFVLLMIFMVFVNYIVGILIDKEKIENDKSKKAKIILTVGIIANIAIIGYFKYSMFFMESINSFFNLTLEVKTIKLPIGISFFTFQAMSYIIDVYRNDGKVQKNLGNLMLYISLFPQLIAGPIVRYSTVDDQIRDRSETVALFESGINRFVIGLGKKIIFANGLAVVADKSFNYVNNGIEISILFAWAGIICYTLQIYFDFSGYSDMAIGLGRMFGFEFVENFNYPYISKSISEFWRRWHISLGSWFRDYVYIPLGGNRCSVGRNIFNLSVVWFLTGLWHGANWTFILWGCYFGVFIILERYVLKDIMDKIPNKLRVFITFILVVLGWVLFRANNLEIAKNYYLVLFGLGDNAFIGSDMDLFIYEYLPLFIIALFAATPFPKNIAEKVFKNKDSLVFMVCEFAFIIGIMYICTASLVASSFNPFIYFNF